MKNIVKGVKHDTGKIRFDLIPIYPLQELGRVYTIGAKKYGDHNWRGGLNWSRVFRALVGHAIAFWGGEDYDKEDGQHHLSSVAWNAFTLMEFQKFRVGKDDRFVYPKKLPKSMKPRKGDSIKSPRSPQAKVSGNRTNKIKKRQGKNKGRWPNLMTLGRSK